MRSLSSAAIVSGVLLAPAARGQVRVFDLAGEKTNLRLGASISALRDVDFDGVPDFVVGSDPLPPSHYGQVELVSGRTGAVLRTLASNVADDGFGLKVLGVGDLDLDGVPDVVVGSPRTVGQDALHLGGVRTFSGRDGSLLWFARPPQGFASTGFGKAIADVGDIDGDGIDDIAIGRCTEPIGGGVSCYSVRVLSGRDGSIARIIRGGQVYSSFDPGFGESVAGPGDVDADGVPDILVGAPGFLWNDPGAVYVWSGRTGGILRWIDGGVGGSRFGTVARAGDIDHDGTPDLLVAAPGYPSNGENSGRVWVLSGQDSSVLLTMSGNSGERFGTFLADAADVNGDGFPDIAVGAPLAGAAGTQIGAVRVFSGRNGALLSEVHGDDSLDHVGPCALAGDLNGDGLADLVAGAPGGDGFVVDSGTVDVYLLGYQPPAQYCEWKWNSLGCGSSPTFDGAPSLSIGPGMTVNVGGIRSRSPGLLVWGRAAASLPFGGGTLCVRPLDHGRVQDSGGTPPPIVDCTGTFSFLFSGAYLSSRGVPAGARVFCQFVSRDDGFPPPFNVGLSEALAFTVLP